MSDLIAFQPAASQTRSLSAPARPYARTGPARPRLADASGIRAWAAARLRRTAQRRYRLADRLDSGLIPGTAA